MNIRRMALSSIATISLVVLTAAAGTAQPGTQSFDGQPERARFEGRWIDLSRGWGEAHACRIAPGRPVECFRSERAMEEQTARTGIPNLSCATPLKLYDLTSFGGTMVTVYSRGLWINLSALSFDNRTSSFKVGSCAIELATANNGGGSHYTRCLSPGCTEDVMLPEWSNMVSSAYLY